MRRWGWLLLIAGVFAACATGPLQPQYWVVWRVDDFQAEQDSDQVRWTYSLILENRGRTAAEIKQGFATSSLGPVNASPEELITRQPIPAGSVLRISHKVVFRSEDFSGTPLGAPKAVKWQFWGNYLDGQHLLMSAEVGR